MRRGFSRSSISKIKHHQHAARASRTLLCANTSSSIGSTFFSSQQLLLVQQISKQCPIARSFFDLSEEELRNVKGKDKKKTGATTTSAAATSEKSSLASSSSLSSSIGSATLSTTKSTTTTTTTTTPNSITTTFNNSTTEAASSGASSKASSSSLDSHPVNPITKESKEESFTSFKSPPKPSAPLTGQCLNYKILHQEDPASEIVYDGRSAEVQCMMDIFSKHEGYNNVMLVGEHGVGRDSIVHAFVQTIERESAYGSLPSRLKNLKVVELNVENLYGCNSTNNVSVAFMNTLEKLGVYDPYGWEIPPHPSKATLKEKATYLFGSQSVTHSKTFVENAFNDRLKTLREYASREKSHGSERKILFIPGLFKMVDDYSYKFYDSISSVLHPLLETKKVQLIGCMTPSEFAMFKNSPLYPFFQIIEVKETNWSDTLKILEKRKDSIETWHGVIIPSELIEEAVRLADRYLPTKNNPSKCISIIDEVAALAERRAGAMPQEILDLEARIKILNIEMDKNNNTQKQDLAKTVQALKTEWSTRNETWTAELNAFLKYKKNKLDIHHLKQELKQCIQLIDSSESLYAKRAAAIIQEDLPALKKEISNFKESLKKNVYVNITASLEDLATVVSRMAGIKPSDIYFSSQSNASLINLESEIEKTIVGQSEAIQTIAQSIRVARSGLREENKPQGAYLLVGRSGTGKTELAKQTAKVLYGSEEFITVIDMTKYNTQWSITGLIGVTPGYIGFETGGELTNAVKRNPHQVIVLDEIEKAHPSIWNVLLPIFEEAMCMDNNGKRISFKHTTIILTSNVGTKRLQEEREDDKDLTRQEIIMEEVKHTFAPEFLNRLDEIVVFNDLTMTHLDTILTLQLRQLEERLSKKKPITITLTPEARQFLLYQSFDIQYGARPIKRNIQTFISSPLAKMIFEGKLDQCCNVLVSIEQKKNLSFTIQVNEEKETEYRSKQNKTELDELIELEYHYDNALKKVSLNNTENQSSNCHVQ
ncbi:hypothetical protein FDP41_007684 [Naegleria fowleri]|uniref:AAA+ ATPase domain-containing protein n=1 Tax=Naegleria fowleri TaxID=5763 RepID=A0A6A5CEM5_NAEFO|nr:uncharacterized protein FDP41_007684 [Naegleria fowleri]KAF0983769.1 hypothetical protein FDP41_007684 [Naegleria fowleri]CAG4710102.1 unnamed protein product [Naegleria fowleri]